ncbi:MAG TPA: 30S ribosomal protein S15 [Bacteroidales bacterium]|jgi:small subunit ribosomal protein S15|nr:30S ribosomal protein S15 [Bacteroidales bacterium]
MYLTAEKKTEIFKKFGKSEKDTGSTQGQVALFTLRINTLTEQLKTNKKDKVTQQSLLKLVGKRRRLLNYIKDTNIEEYRKLIKELAIRK